MERVEWAAVVRSPLWEGEREGGTDGKAWVTSLWQWEEPHRCPERAMEREPTAWASIRGQELSSFL